MTEKIRYITPEDTSTASIEEFKHLPEEAISMGLDFAIAGVQLLRDKPRVFIGREVACPVGLDQDGKPVFDVKFIAQDIIEHDGRTWAVGNAYAKGEEYSEWPVGSRYAIQFDRSLEITERILEAYGRSSNEDVGDPEQMLSFS